jgi:hypothetical protein
MQSDYSMIEIEAVSRCPNEATLGAIVGDRLLIRTKRWLYSIRNEKCGVNPFSAASRQVGGIAWVWILLLSTAAISGCGAQTDDKSRHFSTDSFATVPVGQAALEPVDVAPSLVLEVFTDDKRW